ncbi:MULTISPECIES: thioredoxin family protein [Halobacteriales]|jgi:thioredoxin 1|uniref:Thioredoxin family protein n=2 Tax=Halobacteriales TaxID=2235 RepID=A0ABU2G991_9EURY|nr:MULTISPECIES: thioredoxin family protein [Halobacteria]MDS0284401.1 thioredoxin family protein [Halomicroarcula sp. S3CR25-11]MDS0296833.1 thioredoxin family protein [Halogeometricum sp. S3BR5-2]MDS0478213.1 thioredoxin family protein [Natrinema sp. 1APR25-10V2]
MTEVILFTQETCGACATQREKNEGLEDAYPGVKFREVDIQTDLETAEEYGVRKTPTTLVYANGEQTAEFIGIVDRDELEAAIESAGQQSPGLANRLASIIRG